MSCAGTTADELERLDAVSTPEGQAALALARAIDSGRSLMALPAMTKQLSELMTGIRSRERRESDSVDELRERREAAVRAAG